MEKYFKIYCGGLTDGELLCKLQESTYKSFLPKLDEIVLGHLIKTCNSTNGVEVAIPECKRCVNLLRHYAECTDEECLVCSKIRNVSTQKKEQIEQILDKLNRLNLEQLKLMNSIIPNYNDVQSTLKAYNC